MLNPWRKGGLYFHRVCSHLPLPVSSLYLSFFVILFLIHAWVLHCLWGLTTTETVLSYIKISKKPLKLNNLADSLCHSLPEFEITGIRELKPGFKLVSWISYNSSKHNQCHGGISIALAGHQDTDV